MKIRTITTGFNLKSPLSERLIQTYALKTLKLKEHFTAMGYEVQTIRMTTQPWEKYCRDFDEFIQAAVFLQNRTVENGIDYFSMGPAQKVESIPWIFNFMKETRTGFCTADICGNSRVDYDVALETAELIMRLANLDPAGFTNLRFAALFNMPPGSPFFPASYHSGPASFALGLENSDLVMRAFSESGDIRTAERKLYSIMKSECVKLEACAREIESEVGVAYRGIDVSIAPGVAKRDSIAFAIEKLGLGSFGGPGTLAAARVITETLKSLPVKRCGYSGLMLPVLEDFGLAARNDSGGFNIANLLLYSAVCGTGLDTIPIPGSVSKKKIYALLLDIAALAVKLDKPLSARLMPIPGKRAGERTEFNFDYFVNTTVMPL